MTAIDATICWLLGLGDFLDLHASDLGSRTHDR